MPSAQNAATAFCGCVAAVISCRPFFSTVSPMENHSGEAPYSDCPEANHTSPTRHVFKPDRVAPLHRPVHTDRQPAPAADARSTCPDHPQPPPASGDETDTPNFFCCIPPNPRYALESHAATSHDCSNICGIPPRHVPCTKRRKKSTITESANTNRIESYGHYTLRR